MEGVKTYLINACNTVQASTFIYVLLLLSAVIFAVQYRRNPGFWTTGRVMVTGFFLTTVLHIVFAKTGWFYRYEAYLVALGIIAIAVLLGEHQIESGEDMAGLSGLPQVIAFILTLCLVLPPFAQRAVLSFEQIPQATNNIYDQQYQMGLFQKEYYQGYGVAANDIGAINYLADIRSLDLWGLANIDVAKARRSGYLQFSAHLPAGQR
jgi:hypothetical protein